MEHLNQQRVKQIAKIKRNDQVFDLAPQVAALMESFGCFIEIPRSESKNSQVEGVGSEPVKQDIHATIAAVSNDHEHDGNGVEDAELVIGL